MKTLFIITDKEGAKVNPKTKEQIKKIANKGDETIFKNINEFELLYELKPDKEFDFVCLIPNGCEVNENFLTILQDYQEEREEKIIYMPLVVLTAPKTKGILNSCVWNSNLAEEIGVLSPELSKRQVDTTLYGCLIPFDLFFDEKNYNKNLKYYQHFYFLNKITSDENNVVFGVPKTLLYTNIDLSLPGVDNIEKVKYFKQAQIIDDGNAN